MKTHATVPSPGASGPHPEVEEWIAYHRGKLSADEEHRLRGHLATCPDCVTLLLDLEAFVRPSPEDRAAVSEFEMAAAWRSLRDLLRQKGYLSPRPAWSQRLAWAASLMVGVLGLAAWTAEHQTANQLRGQVAELKTPQLNVPIHDLFPDTTTRSGQTEATQISRSVASTLVLTLTEPQAFADYEVEILDSGGETIWSGRGFDVDPDLGTVTLGMPRGFLAPGKYRVRLHGVTDGARRTLLEELSPIQVKP